MSFSSRKFFLGLACFCLAVGQAEAKVHFVNRGVKYHIGDNRYERSEDKQFVGAYPVVGQQWVQAFRVQADDRVKVRIENIWGVDDCDYCKLLVSIDDDDMGRLLQENNRAPFDTPEPLAVKVKAGRTYLLKITSYGTTQVDDLVIEGVSVQTDGDTEVEFLQPGPVMKAPEDPMPELSAPEPVQGKTCDQLEPCTQWRALRPGGEIQIADNSGKFKYSEALAELRQGQSLRFDLRIADVVDVGDLVSQELGIVFDDGSLSGWVLSFQPKNPLALHGNVIDDGHYSAESFEVSRLAVGSTYKGMIQWCPDGRLTLNLNGKELGTGLVKQKNQYPLRFRALGLSAVISIPN